MVFNGYVVAVKTKTSDKSLNLATPVQPEKAGQETPVKEEAQTKRNARKKED